MSERQLNNETILWYVAGLLTQECDRELVEHLEHEAYAGMVVMQELILQLYPEEIAEIAA